MRIAVTGSIATDQLMVFPGRFADQLVSGQLDRISLSFLVDDLEIRRGGVAANIAFGLGTLGLTPVLVGAVGPDFAEYGAWLERHHVDIRGVHVSETRHTARFFCTTDAAHNQIASFYAGAMAEAAGIDLVRVGELTGPPDLVVLAPDDPDAMVRHTAQCRDAGFAFAADPSQQLARLDRAATRSLVDGATLLFTNQYEHDLLLKTAEWDEAQVLERVGAWVTTLGPRGVRIDRRDHAPVEVAAATGGAELDPTGIGDAFRAGFLWGLSAKLAPERAAQAGCVLAAIALESVGTQEYTVDRSGFSGRVAKAYGADAAGEIEAKLRVGSGL